MFIGAGVNLIKEGGIYTCGHTLLLKQITWGQPDLAGQVYHQPYCLAGDYMIKQGSLINYCNSIFFTFVLKGWAQGSFLKLSMDSLVCKRPLEQYLTADCIASWTSGVTNFNGFPTFWKYPAALCCLGKRSASLESNVFLGFCWLNSSMLRLLLFEQFPCWLWDTEASSRLWIVATWVRLCPLAEQGCTSFALWICRELQTFSLSVLHWLFLSLCECQKAQNNVAQHYSEGKGWRIAMGRKLVRSLWNSTNWIK